MEKIPSITMRNRGVTFEQAIAETGTHNARLAELFSPCPLQKFIRNLDS